MTTKFHAASESIRKLKHLQGLFARPYTKYKSIDTETVAILAGGAIRDDYMGRFDEIKDFDIFIHHLPFPPGQIESIIKDVFPKHDMATQLFDSEYLTLEELDNDEGEVKPTPNSQIVDMWEVDEDNLVYQLIFTKTFPIEHVEKHFDIGFCKGYCDGKRIRYTDDFLRDAWNKTMTIVGDGMTEEQVLYSIDSHVDNLMWKYDDFRVVVPQRYQQFVKGAYPTS